MLLEMLGSVVNMVPCNGPAHRDVRALRVDGSQEEQDEDLHREPRTVLSTSLMSKAIKRHFEISTFSPQYIF